MARPHTRFIAREGLEAAVPAEQRGIARDGVRLLVATRADLSHRRFRDLPEVLEAGDLVVVNTSATVPAALRAEREDGQPARVHLSGWLDPAHWIVEVRRADNRGPDRGGAAGSVLRLPGGVALTLERPHPDSASAPTRLWVVSVTPTTEPVPYLGVHGRPIAYGHLADSLPLSAHQTVYADEPGSAEMPSAGRPFTAELLVRLMAAGITVAPLILHAGVSSPEFHEPPAPERYSVPVSTARLVADTRRAGRRVVAVGTTVVRALETVAADGQIRGGEGWTDLVLEPDRPARVVSGLITGLHLPESSHLLLLEAVAGPKMVADAYATAVDAGYLWHEFGDSMLFLP
ncbi:MAG: S-adenosylmethionine:tRNA ribosyltransferase-isomerase [Candidatus Dormibacteraeota bacterium]|uniref:Queuosine biosynthesis protein n=2 Tax=Candidatus Aeolococcus gillhamiae TaxID=3127015 RepID=A0A2W5ZA09_9BACT|nr:S-adenosylmethionine:tRNA ribosyltransferase-isomerase [Candidatus Dormibacteraeota bacterium]PZR82210.1 MAG: queuosine biosynthesis protein [Candidatus Dormibacter sp. RRmetagenome_bin12]